MEESILTLGVWAMMCCISEAIQSRLAMGAWSLKVAGAMLLNYILLYNWHTIVGIIAL